MKAKKFEKIIDNVAKQFNLNISESKKLKIIDKWYPGPQGLIDEEVLMFGDFEKVHDYQFFIAFLRRNKAKLKKKYPDQADLIDSDEGYTGSL